MVLFTRRQVLESLGFVSLALAVGGCATLNSLPYPDESSIEKEIRAALRFDSIAQTELSTIYEFVDYYKANCLLGQKDPYNANILYPGSGSDVSQLAIGLKLLHESDVAAVDYVFTEIGDLKFDFSIKHWHKGKDNLITTLEKKLERYVAQGLLANKSISVISTEERKVGAKEYQSFCMMFSFDVPTQDKIKRLTITLSYNQSPNRQELTEEEKKSFNEAKHLEKTRGRYWPSSSKIRPGELYPQYATQRQFDDADIILSHLCGDFPLLQFDYQRAILHSDEKKQRVVFTEFPRRNYCFNWPMPGYGLDRPILSNRSYGFTTDRYIGDVGIVIFRPDAK